MQYISVKLIGNSMEPLLRIGDVLLVKKIPHAQLKVGDIIVFENSDKSELITHRILNFNLDGSLMTKPDSSLIQADRLPVEPHKVVGKAIAAYRGSKEIPIENSDFFIRCVHRLFAWLNNSPRFLRLKSSKRLRWMYVLICRIRKIA